MCARENSCDGTKRKKKQIWRDDSWVGFALARKIPSRVSIETAL